MDSTSQLIDAILESLRDHFLMRAAEILSYCKLQRNEPDEKTVSLLFEAARRGDLREVEESPGLRGPLGIRVRGFGGQNLLHCAAASIIPELVKRGLPPDSVDNRSFTPLVLHIVEGNEDAAIALIEAGASDFTTTCLTLVDAVRVAKIFGRARVLARLLARGLKLYDSEYAATPPLPHLERVAASAVGASASGPGGSSPLPPHVLGIPPLFAAVLSGNAHLCRAVLAYEGGVDPNARYSRHSYTPLMLAAELGHRDVCDVLLDHGAHPDLPAGPEHLTPLAAAAALYHIDVCTLLVCRGANVNLRTGESAKTVLMATSESRWWSFKSVGFLLEATGASVYDKDADGRTALHLAVRAGAEITAGYLAGCGAKSLANMKDDKGETVLDLVARPEFKGRFARVREVYGVPTPAQGVAVPPQTGR